MLHGGWKMSWKNDRSWKIWLVCHFCIQVLKACLSSWVLATVAIGFKTKEKKRVYHIDHIYIVCWRQHHRHLRQWETPNVGIWEGQKQSLKSPHPSCQCCKKVYTDDQNFLTGHQWGVTIFRSTCMPLSYIYLIPKLMLSLIFGQSNYTDRKSRPLLSIADFLSWLPLP